MKGNGRKDMQLQPLGAFRCYSLKILCVRSHVSDREFIQFTAEA